MPEGIGSSKEILIDTYRRLLDQHGSGPEVAQWSYEGQRFRFQKLSEVGPLTAQRVLDVGCGLGDLYPFLLQRFGAVAYVGVDVVPELVARAARTYPDTQFTCVDIVAEPLTQRFDYGMISGAFNNAIPDAGEVLRAVVAAAFQHCDTALAFNFISNRVNVVDEGLAYHDPVEIFRFCVDTLSRNVTMHHHYARCDVAVFVYR